MRPSLIRRVAFVSFRLATRAVRCDENSRRSVQFYAFLSPLDAVFSLLLPLARRAHRRHPTDASCQRQAPSDASSPTTAPDGFHARRPSESPILPDAESSLIQPALRYLHQNLLEGGRCLSAGHLVRIAMRARLSISVRLLPVFAPRRRVFSHSNVCAGRLGHRAPISSNPGQHLHQSRRPARLAYAFIRGPRSRCDGSLCGAMGLACDAIGSQNATSGHRPSRTPR
ncbi:hypothetical protein GGF50DRAFT_105522, partial [Schizophyllum commune]